MNNPEKFALILLIPAVVFLFVMWWQQRRWFAETLLLCDQPSEVLRGAIGIAVARWGWESPLNFRVESETADGVVLRVRHGWRPGLWQRVSITVQEGAIRIVSEGTLPAGFGGWQNLESVRDRVSRAIEWARGRTLEEIEQERRKGPLAGPV